MVGENIQNKSHEKMRFLGEEMKILFRDFLNVFNKILLPTHDSSHVQYLLFYLCSYHSVSIERKQKKKRNHRRKFL